MPRTDKAEFNEENVADGVNSDVPRDKDEDKDAAGSQTIADAIAAKAAPERVTTVEEIKAKQPQVFAMPPDEYKAREMARIKAEAAELNSDETVEGGRYQIGDKFYNAHGEELGSAKE